MNDQDSKVTTQDAEALPRKRRPYASPLIAERRHRILKQTLALIAEKGVDGFTLRQLSMRAEVAPKTLYNAFGDKETLIARAIDYYLDNQSETLPPVDLRNIDDIIAQLDGRCRDFIGKREWVRATNLLYFSFTIDDRIYQSLRSMALLYLHPCLELFARSGDLEDWVPVETVESQFASTVHGITHDWLMGRLPDAQFPDAVNYSLISAMVPLVREELRQTLIVRLRGLGARLKPSATQSG